MSQALRAKVREISQEALRRMEADASIAMLELSATFRKHVNRNLRDMAVLMATPRPEDADWRRRLHELSRDLQGASSIQVFFAGAPNQRAIGSPSRRPRPEETNL